METNQRIIPSDAGHSNGAAGPPTITIADPSTRYGAPLNPLVLRILQLLAVPAVILLAAALAVRANQALPASLSGLTVVGPYIVLLLGAAISAWFNRSRALIMLASLLAPHAGYHLAPDLAPRG